MQWVEWCLPLYYDMINDCVWWHDVNLSRFLHCRLTATYSSKREVQGQTTSLFSYKTLRLCSWNNELVGHGQNILWISCFCSFDSHEISSLLDVNACRDTKSRQSSWCWIIIMYMYLTVTCNYPVVGIHSLSSSVVMLGEGGEFGCL